MMDIKTYLYNTLTKSVDEFVPNEEGKVAMYTCGPTVYHFAHIGNLRSYIMEDVLEKYLRYVGYDVKRVMNITDVGHLTSDGDTGEDKMLKGAKREHKTVMDIARFYTDAFMADCEKLSIKRPDVVEPATNCIPEFIHMIEVLLEKGYAYIAGENVYFDTSKLDNYYVLSSQNEEDLQVGVREDVEEDTNKRIVTYVAKTAAWSLLSFVCSNYLTRMWISMPSPIRTMCGTKTSFPSPARSLNRCANQNPQRKRRMIPRSVHLPHHFSTVVMPGTRTMH